MTDFASLLEMAGSIAILVAPAVLLNRWLAGAEGPSLADLLAIPVDLPWPRGVQEEEPVRWHVEALRARRAAEPSVAVGESRKAGTLVAGLTTDRGEC